MKSLRVGPPRSPRLGGDFTNSAHDRQPVSIFPHSPGNYSRLTATLLSVRKPPDNRKEPLGSREWIGYGPKCEVGKLDPVNALRKHMQRGT